MDRWSVPQIYLTSSSIFAPYIHPCMRNHPPIRSRQASKLHTAKTKRKTVNNATHVFSVSVLVEKAMKTKLNKTIIYRFLRFSVISVFSMGSLEARLAGWLAGWLAGQLDGWMASQPASQLDSQADQPARQPMSQVTNKPTWQAASQPSLQATSCKH